MYLHKEVVKELSKATTEQIEGRLQRTKERLDAGQTAIRDYDYANKWVKYYEYWLTLTPEQIQQLKDKNNIK
jgi:hypothetical protein